MTIRKRTFDSIYSSPKSCVECRETTHYDGLLNSMLNPIKNTFNAHKWQATFFIVAFVLFLVLVTYASSGPYIDDHYWYLADIESILQGRGVQSNNIFPIEAIQGKVINNPPFVHNSPFIYIAAVLGIFFGAYSGWILLSILCSLLAAWLIYKTVSLVANTSKALLAGGFYLLLPSTIWVSSELIVEAMIAPFMVWIVYLYLSSKDRFLPWIWMILMAVFVSITKANFVLLLAIIPGAYLVHHWRKKFYILRTFALVFVAIITFFVITPLFPNNAASSENALQSYLNIIHVGVPGKTSNMESYFNIHPTNYSFDEYVENLVLKTKKSLRLQLLNVNLDGIAFYIPFNILYLLCITGLFFSIRRKKKLEKKLYGAAIVLFFVYLLTICLMQNQFRYMQMFYPIPLIGAFGYAYHRHKEFPKHQKKQLFNTVLFSIVTLFLVYISFTLIQQQRAYGISAAERYQTFSESIHSVPATDAIMVEGIKYYTLYGYVLQPRRVLYVIDSYTQKDLETIMRNGSATWLLCEDSSPIIDTLHLLGTPRTRLLSPLENLVLVKLE